MDTLELRLADQSGKWLGSGIGNIWQNQIPLVSRVKMTEKGTYKVAIKHGMRDSVLRAVADVGLRVEKSERQ